jgi:hypothetical protein
MKQLPALILFLCIWQGIQAQNYTQTFGFRGGQTSGLTYARNTGGTGTNEFIFKIKANYMNLTYLRTSYAMNMFNLSPKFVVYKGFGGHVGYRYANQFRALFVRYEYPNKQFVPVLGFDAIFGMEYHIDEYPVSVGIDYKPFFEFSTKQIYNLQVFDIALNVKYRF